mgnify:CR=1 FL=1
MSLADEPQRVPRLSRESRVRRFVVRFRGCSVPRGADVIYRKVAGPEDGRP